MAAAASPHGTPSEAAVDLMAEGTRVVMAPGKRWQGVGTINRMHDNGTTCAVKWDSGRLDRSLLLADLIMKKVKPVSEAPATPAPASSQPSASAAPTQDLGGRAGASPSPAKAAAIPDDGAATAAMAGNGVNPKAGAAAGGGSAGGGASKVLVAAGVLSALGALVALTLLRRK